MFVLLFNFKTSISSFVSKILSPISFNLFKLPLLLQGLISLYSKIFISPNSNSFIGVFIYSNFEIEKNPFCTNRLRIGSGNSEILSPQ